MGGVAGVTGAGPRGPGQKPRGRSLALRGVARGLEVGFRAPELGASGAEPETRGRGVCGRAGTGGGGGEASSPKDSAGQRAVGCGRRRASHRTRPGHGAAGSGRAAAGVAAARAAARGECAWPRAVGGGRAPTWRGHRRLLGWDSGPGRPRPRRTLGWHWPAPPSSVGLSLGDAPGTQRGGQGPSLQAWKPEGLRPRCSGSESPLGMTRPAVLGALTEKLLAGWELGRTRVPLSAANLAEEALRGDGDPVSFRWNFTMLSSGETIIRQS